MKENRMHEKPACSVISAPVPVEIECPYCNVEIEMWSDETEIECKRCGKRVQNRESRAL